MTIKIAAGQRKPAQTAQFKVGHGFAGGGHGACAACNHQQVRVINEALIAKVPLRMLGAAYGLSHAALSRHSKNHVAHHTVEQRMLRVVDRLLAKCDEFEAREVQEEADDEVFGVIDDLRQEILAVKSNSRLWSV
jgi:hypothetical protein